MNMDTLIAVEDQSYYWTDEWQRGVRASREDFDKGNYTTFDDPLEALRWLRENS